MMSILDGLDGADESAWVPGSVSAPVWVGQREVPLAQEGWLAEVGWLAEGDWLG